MGKASRKNRHSDKMKRKRELKAQRRSLYASLAGTSKKSKNKNGKKMPTRFKGSHMMADCGNVGCKRCYPKLNGVLVKA